MTNTPNCAKCKDKKCRGGKDCYNKSLKSKKHYEVPTIVELHKAATKIEGKYYCKETRLNEIILFAKELKVKTIGIAFCVGLSEEAEKTEEILSRHFKVVSVCCKVTGTNKKDYKLKQINPAKEEVMCNPAIQAELLNDAKTELNVVIGLCVGHDSIFYMTSKAPVTTFITKDRVLAHNPAAALYCHYIRDNFET